MHSTYLTWLYGSWNSGKDIFSHLKSSRSYIMVGTFFLFTLRLLLCRSRAECDKVAAEVGRYHGLRSFPDDAYSTRTEPNKKVLTINKETQRRNRYQSKQQQEIAKGWTWHALFYGLALLRGWRLLHLRRESRWTSFLWKSFRPNGTPMFIQPRFIGMRSSSNRYPYSV